MSAWAVTSLILLTRGPARADDLGALLRQGDLVLITPSADGHVQGVRTWSWYDAPVDVVWQQIVAYDAYAEWMPRVHAVEVLGRGEGFVDIRWTLKVPGPKLVFAARYHVDEASRTIRGQWLDGALEGSSWTWHLVPDDGGTRVERELKTTAVTDSWLLQQFDDRWHTLEFGINAATPIVEAQGMRQALRGRR